MSGSAFNRFGGGVSSARVGRIVRAMVLAIWYHTLTEMDPVYCVVSTDRGLEVVLCRDSHSLSLFVPRHCDPVVKASPISILIVAFYNPSLSLKLCHGSEYSQPTRLWAIRTPLHWWIP